MILILSLENNSVVPFTEDILRLILNLLARNETLYLEG